MIPQTARPARQRPVAHFQAMLVCNAHLAADEVHLALREVEGPWVADCLFERHRGIEAVRSVEGGCGDYSRHTRLALAKICAKICAREEGCVWDAAVWLVRADEFIERGVEEDIAIGGVFGDEVEGCIPRSDDGDGALDELVAVEVG